MLEYDVSGGRECVVISLHRYSILGSNEIIHLHENYPTVPGAETKLDNKRCYQDWQTASGRVQVGNRGRDTIVKTECIRARILVASNPSPAGGLRRVPRTEANVSVLAQWSLHRDRFPDQWSSHSSQLRLHRDALHTSRRRGMARRRRRNHPSSTQKQRCSNTWSGNRRYKKVHVLCASTAFDTLHHRIESGGKQAQNIVPHPGALTRCA